MGLLDVFTGGLEGLGILFEKLTGTYDEDKDDKNEEEAER
jgi:hypothetical protein